GRQRLFGKWMRWICGIGHQYSILGAKVICAAHHPGERARESARMRTGDDPEYANDLGGSQAQRGARADSIARLICEAGCCRGEWRTWGQAKPNPFRVTEHPTRPNPGVGEKDILIAGIARRFTIVSRDPCPASRCAV